MVAAVAACGGKAEFEASGGVYGGAGGVAANATQSGGTTGHGVTTSSGGTTAQGSGGLGAFGGCAGGANPWPDNLVVYLEVICDSGLGAGSSGNTLVWYWQTGGSATPNWDTGTRRGDDTLATQCGIQDASAPGDQPWTAYPSLTGTGTACGYGEVPAFVPVGTLWCRSGMDESCTIGERCCYIVSGFLGG